MNIIEVNEGPKISHSVVGDNWLNLGDRIMLNLANNEADYDVNIDVTADSAGRLGTGSGLYYVAQIEIPARQYTEKKINNPDYNPEDENSEKKITKREPVPFSMDNVTLKLFALKEGVFNE